MKKSVHLGLALAVDRENHTGLRGYFHVRLTVVTIDDTLDLTKGVRSISGELFNGLRLESLQIYSQGDDDSRRRDDGRARLYAWEVEYAHPYRVRLNDVREMHKTLTFIDRRLHRLADKYGRPRSFGEFVARVAEAIGATTILRATVASSSPYHSQKEYAPMSVGEGANHIDRVVEQWAAEGDTPTGPITPG